VVEQEHLVPPRQTARPAMVLNAEFLGRRHPAVNAMIALGLDQWHHAVDVTMTPLHRVPTATVLLVATTVMTPLMTGVVAPAPLLAA